MSPATWRRRRLLDRFGLLRLLRNEPLPDGWPATLVRLGKLDIGLNGDYHDLRVKAFVSAHLKTGSRRSQMKILNSAIVVVLFGLASSLHAESPSSVAAQSGTKPSTVNTNGGFDFKARDSGEHSGWCKGQGHLVSPGNEGSGHRNHWDCDGDGGSGDPAVCLPGEILINGVCWPWV